MTGYQDRIAAGQELRRRGKLSSEQVAALTELERRYGGDLSTERLQGSAGMVEQGTISRDEYMRTRGGVGFNGQPLAQADYGTAPEAPPMTFTDEGVLGQKYGMRRSDIVGMNIPMLGEVGGFDPSALDRPQDVGARPRMSRAQSAAMGINDLNPVRLLTGDRGWEDSMAQSLEDNPATTRLGQAASMTAGGGAQLSTKAMIAAPKLVSPKIAARVAGKSVPARLARYGGRLASLAGIGAADFAAFNVLAEAPNIERETGEEVDRFGYAASELGNPMGWAPLPLASLAYRGLRGGITAGANSARATAAASRPAAGEQSTAAAGLPALRPRVRSGQFTPRDVRDRVSASTINPSTGRTAREEAIDLLLKKGFDPDDAEKAVKLISYDRYTDVDEMLFELSNANVDQLTVALGRVGGDAKRTLRENFQSRNAEMPDRIRTALRDAMGLSGDDLEDFASQMAAKADDATREGYSAAYATSVTPKTWENIWDLFRVSPDAAEALKDGARLARNSYLGNPAQLEAARELDALAVALRTPGELPPPVSTRALDYLDRGFGSLITGAKKNNKAHAGSLIGIRNAIRSAGLDADTGLSGPRGVYSQYMAASRAMDFGAKAFGRGTPLRDIKKQFATSLKDADEVFEEIAGEGKSVVDQALVMGWLRGAEDAVETATNPGVLIRQIYGSERQRAKLLEMMPDVPKETSSGLKSDQTKRTKALVGSQKNDYKYDFQLGSGERTSGRTTVQSLFDRQRRMLDSQNRISGNSQTADASEAIAAQGGLQRTASFLTKAVMSPQQAAQNAIIWASQRATMPAIFKGGVNRELGDILSVRGREKLLGVIDEIRQRQIARSGDGSTSIRAPLTGPAAGGGTAASGFGPFSRRPSSAPPSAASDLLANQSLSPDYARLLPRMQKAAETFQGRDFESIPGAKEALQESISASKGASDDQIIEQAWSLMRRRQQNGASWPPSPESLRPAGMDEYGPILGRLVSNRKFFEVDLDTAIRDSLTDLDDILAREGLRRGDDTINVDQLQQYVSNSGALNEGAAPVRALASHEGGPTRRPNSLLRGLRQDLANTTGGAVGGGVMPMPSSGDFRQDVENRLNYIRAGAAAGLIGGRFGKSVLDNSVGLGPRGPRKPRADSPDAIRAGIQKITEGIKARKPQSPSVPQSDMRIGPGSASAMGIKSDPKIARNVAEKMLQAGRTAEEVYQATGRLTATVGDRSLSVSPPKGMPYEEALANFWASLMQPVRNRPTWMQRETRSIRDMSKDAPHKAPFEQRQDLAQSVLDDPEFRSSFNYPEDFHEELDVIPVFANPDGQMAFPLSISDAGNTISLRGFVDGSRFKNYEDFLDQVEKIQSMPYERRPGWYKAYFSDPLELRHPRIRDSRLNVERQALDEIGKRPIVGGVAGGALAGSTIGLGGAAYIEAAQRNRP